MKHYSYLIYLSILFPVFSFTFSPVNWQELEKGLSYASIDSPVKSSHSDSKIEVLKIDPAYFSFHLLCAGEKKSNSKKADEWCKEYKMIAGVNASMFKLDGNFNQSTGYLKNKNYTNNGILNNAYKNNFAFNTNDTAASAPHIVDLSCENWSAVKNKYTSFSQSLRMLDCDARNTGQPQQKKWSMVLLGEDKNHHILFIFVRSPYTVHAYINILNSLPLQLTRLMYLEGGPEASFYLNHPKLKKECAGSYETGFNENDNNKTFWDIPNMITIRKKE